MDSYLLDAHRPPPPNLGRWIAALRIGAWVLWAVGASAPLWLGVPMHYPAAIKVIALVTALFWVFIAGAIPWTIAFALESIRRIKENIAQRLNEDDPERRRRDWQ